MIFKYVSVELTPVTEKGELLVEEARVIQCKSRRHALRNAKKFKKNNMVRIITEEQLI